MKKLLLLAPFALLGLMTACRDKDEQPTPTPTPTPQPCDTCTTQVDNADSVDEMTYTTATITRTTSNDTTLYKVLDNGATLSGSILRNTTLKSGNTYKLNGFVFVRNGATLKIEPGVRIEGDKASKATLIVTRNGKIDAQGTPAQPIIFTTAETSPSRGGWGGIIILGNARNNATTSGVGGLAVIEGGVNVETEGYGLHGGTTDGDNSGTLKYVRIEYPGIAFVENNEINGLTMGSVGSGTTIQYVEVYQSGDDAFEWFGGTVNAKYLIASQSTDDDFDTDFGFSGKVQYGISLRDPNQADFGPSGTSNGFESDNDAGGTTASPKTSAVFSNFTMIGPKAQAGVTPVAPFGRGAHIRRNSATSVFNSVFVGWNTGLRIDGRATNANYVAGEGAFANNFVVNASKNIDTTGTSSATSPIDPAAYFTANNNTADASLAAVMLANLAIAAFDPNPTSGSPVLSGASFSSSRLAGFENTSYRGATGPGGSAWYSGWARF